MFEMKNKSTRYGKAVEITWSEDDLTFDNFLQVMKNSIDIIPFDSYQESVERVISMLEKYDFIDEETKTHSSIIFSDRFLDAMWILVTYSVTREFNILDEKKKCDVIKKNLNIKKEILEFQNTLEEIVNEVESELKGIDISTED